MQSNDLRDAVGREPPLRPLVSMVRMDALGVVEARHVLLLLLLLLLKDMSATGDPPYRAPAVRMVAGHFGMVAAETARRN